MQSRSTDTTQQTPGSHSLSVLGHLAPVAKQAVMDDTKWKGLREGRYIALGVSALSQRPSGFTVISDHPGYTLEAKMTSTEGP